jgi:2-methylcitrate dehydratase PrpD
MAETTSTQPPWLNPTNPDSGAWAQALHSVGHLPTHIHQKVEVAVADTIACIVAGRGFPIPWDLPPALGLATDRGRLSLLPVGSDPSRTALMLGTLAHVADLDDVCWTMMGHPSAPVMSAALANVPELEFDGGTFVASVAAGLEAVIGLGRLLVPEIYRRGWHATSVLGVVSAAVTSGKLLGLGVDELHHAMGIAASGAAGLRVNFGSQVKSLHVGRAASLGLDAARLAASGVTADRNWLTGRHGFLDVFAYERAQPEAEVGPPEDWLISRPGILTKIHASCAATHPAVDAAIELRDHLGADFTSVKRIRVEAAPTAALPLITRLPTSVLEAKFSMEFCVAAALVRGDLGLAAFTPSTISDEAVQGLMHRIDYVSSDEFADVDATDNRASAARVTLELVDGTSVSTAVEYPRGSPESPITLNELDTKLADCWRFGTGRGDSEAIRQAARALVSAGDGREPIRHLEAALATSPNT